MSALARLTLYENLLIGQETSVRCPHQRVSVLSRVESRENVRAFFPPGTKQTVCNNEVSVLSGCAPGSSVRLYNVGHKRKMNPFHKKGICQTHDIRVLYKNISLKKNDLKQTCL